MSERSSIKIEASLVLWQTIFHPLVIIGADSLSRKLSSYWPGQSVSDGAYCFRSCDKHICGGRFLWQLTVMHLIHYKQPLPKATLHVNMPFRYKAYPQVVTLVSNKAAAVRVAKGKERAHCASVVTQFEEVVQQVWLFLPNPFHEWRFGCQLALHLWNFFHLAPSSSSVSLIQCKKTETAQVSFLDTLQGEKLNFLIPGGSSPNLKRSSFWNSFTFPLRLNDTVWGGKRASLSSSLRSWFGGGYHAGCMLNKSTRV